MTIVIIDIRFIVPFYTDWTHWYMMFNMYIKCIFAWYGNENPHSWYLYIHTYVPIHMHTYNIYIYNNGNDVKERSWYFPHLNIWKSLARILSKIQFSAAIHLSPHGISIVIRHCFAVRSFQVYEISETLLTNHLKHSKLKNNQNKLPFIMFNLDIRVPILL